MTDAFRQPNDLCSDHQGAPVPIGCDALLSEPLDGEVELVRRTLASRVEPKLEVLGIEELEVVPDPGLQAVTRYEMAPPQHRWGSLQMNRRPPCWRIRSGTSELETTIRMP
jgi:hypothetical protein